MRSRQVDIFGVAIDKDAQGNFKTSFAKQYLLIFGAAVVLGLGIGGFVFWREAGPQALDFLRIQIFLAMEQFAQAVSRK